MQKKMKKTFSNRSMSGSKEILIGTLKLILTVIQTICNKAEREPNRTDDK